MNHKTCSINTTTLQHVWRLYSLIRWFSISYWKLLLISMRLFYQSLCYIITTRLVYCFINQYMTTYCMELSGLSIGWHSTRKHYRRMTYSDQSTCCVVTGKLSLTQLANNLWIMELDHTITSHTEPGSKTYIIHTYIIIIIIDHTHLPSLDFLPKTVKCYIYIRHSLVCYQILTS